MLPLSIEPFQVAHAIGLDARRLRPADRAYQVPEYLERLAQSGPAVTARIGGEVMLCIGIAINPADQARWLWSVLPEDSSRHFLRLHRAVEKFLAKHPGPMTALSEHGHSHGCRWLQIFGFQRIEAMKPLFDGGPEYDVYQRG